MVKTFSELVIEGPFLLVKGFLMGYKYSCNPNMDYFFHRKAGIKRETLKDVLQEYFELDSYTHVCLENAVIERFAETIKASEDSIKLKIKSRKLIVSASFTFHFEVFNREKADEIRKLINSIPSTLHLENFKEDEYTENEGRGIEMYAPLHDYSYSGRGHIRGEFSDLIGLYKTFNNQDSMETTRVELELKD